MQLLPSRDGQMVQTVGAPFARDSGAALETEARSVISALRRNWRLVAVTAALTFAAMVLAIFSVTPRYTAEATLFIDPRQTNVANFQGVVSALPTAMEPVAVVHSEVELLEAPSLALEVVQALDLVHDPRFNLALNSRHPSLASSIAAPVARALRFVGLDAAAAAVAAGSAPPSADREVARLAEQLSNNLTVADDGKSYVVHARFQWYSPDLAAAVLNKLVEIHLQHQLAFKTEATTRASTWLQARIPEIRQQLGSSDKALQDFREQHHLSEARGTTVAAQQMAELNSQLILASAERAKKESLLDDTKRTLGAKHSNASIASVLGSPLIQRLQEQEAELMRRSGELSTVYGQRHPLVIAANRQLADLRKKISDETNKIVASLSSDIVAARAHEKQLRSDLTRVQEAAATADRDDMLSQEMSREVDANRMLLDDMLMRAKQTGMSADTEQPDTRLASAAISPRLPSFPKKELFLAIGALAALQIGAAAGLLRDRARRTFLTPEELEDATDAPVIGVIPELRSRDGSLADCVIAKPRSHAGEAVRSVKTSLDLAMSGGERKVVLLTSALPNEAKTTLVASLARCVARSGRRVLLIDCDLRKPGIGRILGIDTPDQRKSFLHLEDDGSSEIINVDLASGLHHLTAHANDDGSHDPLDAEAMSQFIARMRPNYDLILIDSPPVLAVSDPLVLSRLADFTLFLVRWNHTPRTAVLGALRKLRSAGVRVGAIALTRANVRRYYSEVYGGINRFGRELTAYYSR